MLSHLNLSMASIVKKLERSREIVETVIDSVDVVITILDSSGRILKGNRKLAELMQCDVEELYPKHIEELFTPDDAETFRFELHKIIEISESFQSRTTKAFELPINFSQGVRIYDYVWSIKAIDQNHGKGIQKMYALVGQDITDLKDSQRQIAQTLSNIPLGLLNIDKGGIIQDNYSRYVTEILGDKDFVGKNIANYLVALDEDKSSMPVLQKLSKIPEQTKLRQGPYQIPISISIYPITLKNNVAGAAIVIQNRSEMEKMRRKVAAAEKLILIDPLTGVGNRRGFEELLQAEYYRSLRHKHKLGLLMVDIDHFKLYNDHYGHPMGDKVISEVAKGIAASVQRKSDGVFRYGGEEFSVVLPETDQTGVERVCAVVVNSIRNLNIEHIKSKTESIVTVSIGAKVFNPDVEPNLSLNDFIKQADQALYQAKEQGRNQFVLIQH